MSIRRLCLFASIIPLLLCLSGCGGPKPYYKTRVGKKKQKYYNEIQFSGQSAADMDAPKQPKRKQPKAKKKKK